MIATEQLRKLVEEFRELIEPLWSVDMLYEKFNPHPENTKSAGYCGPSSILLMKHLSNKYPGEKFTLAVGRVYLGKEEMIPGKHVWVVMHNKLKSATVIDITADQSKKIKSKVIVDDIDTLSKKDIHYAPYQLAHDEKDIDESPLRRAGILEEKIIQQQYSTGLKIY